VGDRWRLGFIALTAVVVVLAIGSAVYSSATPKPTPSEALYTSHAMQSPSPRPAVTPQPATPTPIATGTPTPSPTFTPVATGTPTPSPTFTSYVVQPGETLNSIADRFGVTLQAVLFANPSITDANRIEAGQVILIPPPEWAPSPSPRSS
jgi:LysM repeat protein